MLTYRGKMDPKKFFVMCLSYWVDWLRMYRFILQFFIIGFTFLSGLEAKEPLLAEKRVENKNVFTMAPLGVNGFESSSLFFFLSMDLWRTWASQGGAWENEEYQKKKTLLESSPFVFVYEIDKEARPDDYFDMVKNLKDRNINRSEFSRKWPYIRYVTHLDLMIENVEQHASGRGIILLQFDESQKKLFIAAMDLGPGFDVSPQKNALNIVKLDDGSILQREGSPGRGAAMRDIGIYGDELTVYSKGFGWNYKRGHVPFNEQFQWMPPQGTLMIFENSKRKKHPYKGQAQLDHSS